MNEGPGIYQRSHKISAGRKSQDKSGILKYKMQTIIKNMPKKSTKQSSNSREERASPEDGVRISTTRATTKCQSSLELLEILNI